MLNHVEANKEHSVLPNLLNREFKQDVPGRVLLSDITYLFYKNDQRAYLSTVLDGSTNELLTYNLYLDEVTSRIMIPRSHFLDNLRTKQILKICNTFAEILEEIDEYMDCYNNYRCQWNLKKMTPVKYRNHLLSIA